MKHDDDTPDTDERKTVEFRSFVPRLVPPWLAAAEQEAAAELEQRIDSALRRCAESAAERDQPTRPADLVSVGYEGRTAGELVHALAGAGVGVLVDVRLNAISRKRGLSKRALAALLIERGIAYIHEPTLGNPRDNRDGFRDGTPESIAAFEAHLAAHGSDALDRLNAMLKDQTVAVLCFEADPCACHRSIVAQHILDRNPLASVRQV